MSQPIAPQIPFAIAQGRVAVDQSPVSQMRSRVTALASTQPGQRVMATGFGVNTAARLFNDHNDPLFAQEIANDLRNAMRFYEPGAHLVSVQPVASPAGTGIAAVVANAERKDTSSMSAAARGTSTVRIEADGSVVDYASSTTPS